MLVTASVRAMPQPSSGPVEDLTTEEAIRALFPQRVIDQARQVARLSDKGPVSTIARDASGPRAL